MDLVLNNLQRLICHETQTNQPYTPIIIELKIKCEDLPNDKTWFPIKKEKKEKKTNKKTLKLFFILFFSFLSMWIEIFFSY